MRAGVLALALLLATESPVLAQSPLVAELERVATRYHEDPRSLDAVREGLARAVAGAPHVDSLVALARACFLVGDVRATTTEEKLAAYAQGREAAQRAVAAAPRRAAAHFWYATNTARWGQTKGVLRSLFLLPEVRRGIDTVLDLDPTFTAVYSLAGNVYYEVPGFLGGDLARAETMFRKGLEQDPKFTGMRVGLAKTLIKLGRAPEARRELETVLGERSPSNLADWKVKDVPEARRLLQSLEGKS